jgi:hypothetical protein
MWYTPYIAVFVLPVQIAECQGGFLGKCTSDPEGPWNCLKSQISAAS